VSLRPLRGSLARWTPGAGATVDPLQAISSAWSVIVGPDVAANSAPIALAHGALTIATRSSAWSQQLQFLSVSIERGIAEHAPGAKVTKLHFRAGAFRPSERRAASLPAASRARRRGDVAAYEPAADLADAMERVRARIRDARRASDVTCPACGAPRLPGTQAQPCTPCAIAAARERTLELERLLFAAPWLKFEEIREQLPRVTVAEYERSRRTLLGRWWLVLERARTAQRLANPANERSIASSYVLLSTRLPPDRITPAVLQNTLGPELCALLEREREALGVPRVEPKTR
jgi:hypothetical protein